MRKEKMFAMRMSQPDYDRIQHKAGQAGMSMTGFLTASALDKNIVVVDGLDKVVTELKAIGKNLNQLTTLWPLQGKMKPSLWRWCQTSAKPSSKSKYRRQLKKKIS